MNDAITPAEIRAELARRQWPKYEFAARVHVHPATLGKMLAEHRPIPPAVRERIRRVFEEPRSA